MTTLPGPTEFHGDIEMWNTYPRVNRRGEDIWLGVADEPLNDNEALALAAALASAAQRAHAERNAHDEVERAVPPTESKQGGEITHLVYEGEIVADVVGDAAVRHVDQICTRCILCGEEFPGVDGHECRVRVVRGTGLF
ncbi:hypothetical protein SEA_BIGGITYBASS_66 [Gordonia phage BiggityBass]|nr:hypothetical protein SEA_BIGGITYBASS_66 [Gordonia phage BiggityBass]